ncbi:MAG: hypothetical protein HY350_00615 [Candidatus Omnitrophica bacterium]|nr:hypothetical protein [Candidatus Omnitrophota bacterium]
MQIKVKSHQILFRILAPFFVPEIVPKVMLRIAKNNKALQRSKIIKKTDLPSENEIAVGNAGR